MKRTVDDAELQGDFDSRHSKTLISQQILELWVCESLYESCEMRDLRYLAGGRHRSQKRWISLRKALLTLRQSGTRPSQLSREWANAFQNSLAFAIGGEWQGEMEGQSRDYRGGSRLSRGCLGLALDDIRQVDLTKLSRFRDRKKKK